MQAKDKQEYIDVWDSYIEELNALIWETDEEDGQIIQKAILQLKDIVKNNAERDFN